LSVVRWIKITQNADFSGSFEDKAKDFPPVIGTKHKVRTLISSFRIFSSARNE
jgi:hypothetical protein